MTARELKSKVMALGNRLSKTMPRRDAFIQAWQICKKGGIELPVRGVTVGSRQEALRRLASYAPDQVWAFIVPELENKFDRNAAAVFVGVQNGKGLYCTGYLPKEYAPAARNLKVVGLRVIGDDLRGCRLSLAVWP